MKKEDKSCTVLFMVWASFCCGIGVGVLVGGVMYAVLQ